MQLLFTRFSKLLVMHILFLSSISIAADLQIRLAWDIDEKNNQDKGKVVSGDPIFIKMTCSNPSKNKIKLPLRYRTFTADDFHVTLSDSPIHNYGEHLSKYTFKKKDSLDAGESVSILIDLLDMFPPEISIGRAITNLYRSGKLKVQLSKTSIKLSSDIDPKKELKSNELSCDISPIAKAELEAKIKEYSTSENTRKNTKILPIIYSLINNQMGKELSKLLVSGNITVKQAVCWALYSEPINDSLIIGELHRIIGSENQDNITKSFAIFSLTGIKNQRSKELLKKILSSQKRSRLFYATLQALDKWPDPFFKETIKKVSEDESVKAWARKRAERILKKIPVN